jgi:hypothetical protein
MSTTMWSRRSKQSVQVSDHCMISDRVALLGGDVTYPPRPCPKQTQTQNMEDQHLKDPSGQYLGVRFVQQTLHVDRTPCCYAGQARTLLPTMQHCYLCEICGPPTGLTDSAVRMLCYLTPNRPSGSSRRFGGPWGLHHLCVYTYITMQSTIFIIKSNIICFRTTQKLKTKRRMLWSREKLRFSANRKKY